MTIPPEAPAAICGSTVFSPVARSRSSPKTRPESIKVEFSASSVKSKRQVRSSPARG